MNLDLLAAQAKAARDRGHDLAAEGLQVVRREKTVVLPLVCEDSARDVAPVERMAHRCEAGHAVVAGRALLIAEKLQGPAQIGLDQPLARRRHLAAGHPDCDVLRPLAELVGVLAHVIEHDRVTGKAVRSVAHGARRHVAEGHRAPSLQRLDAGIGGGRHDGAPQPRAEWFPRGVQCRHSAIERPRPAADACNRDHLAGLREADDHRRDPGNAHLIAVDHAESQDCRDACVDRVAAVLQRLERSQCREFMPRADDVVMATGDGYDGHGSLRTSRGAGRAEYRL